MCKREDTMPGTWRVLNDCRKRSALFWQLQNHTLSRHRPVSDLFHSVITRAPPWQAGITATSIWRDLEPQAWLRTHSTLGFWWPVVWPSLFCRIIHRGNIAPHAFIWRLNYCSVPDSESQSPNRNRACVRDSTEAWKEIYLAYCCCYYYLLLRRNVNFWGSFRDTWLQKLLSASKYETSSSQKTYKWLLGECSSRSGWRLCGSTEHQLLSFPAASLCKASILLPSSGPDAITRA